MHAFRIRVEPTAAANADDIAEAIAHVWVAESDRTHAEQRARVYVMDLGWIARDVVNAFTPTPEEIAALDPIESANYRRAVREGINGYFVCWPKQPRPEDSGTELRRMSRPPSSESKN